LKEEENINKDFFRPASDQTTTFQLYYHRLSRSPRKVRAERERREITLLIGATSFATNVCNATRWRIHFAWTNYEEVPQPTLDIQRLIWFYFRVWVIEFNVFVHDL
jgi:hypothetical protein